MNQKVHIPHTVKVPSDLPILLVDMDGVGVDYYQGFLNIWKAKYPDRKALPSSEVKSFYIEDSYKEYPESDIRDITTSKGFFLSLPPMPGFVETMKKILAEGKFNPMICTSPDTDCEGQVCHSEKAQWIEKYLGPEWVKRLILTNDKTLVIGTFLVDDKPNITGVNATPDWIQIVFTQPYNDDKDMKAKVWFRLNGWENWDEFVSSPPNVLVPEDRVHP
jgi:5'-nucleotidase